MQSTVLMLLAAVFLSGGVLGVFLMLLVGIHTEERHLSLTHTPHTRTTVSTRRLLGVTVRSHTTEETTRPTLTR